MGNVTRRAVLQAAVGAAAAPWNLVGASVFAADRAEEDRAEEDRAEEDPAEEDPAEEDPAEEDRAEEDRAEEDRAEEDIERSFKAVECQGAYPKHLQGICTNDRDAIYWCFTTDLVKTDLSGQVLRHVPVANHHGDLCFHEGKLYVAVNLGKFNQPAGQADSWVYVYCADTLRELARHRTPELVHGAGGVACREGRFVVVGGLPEGVDENYAYEYNGDFAFRKRHVLASGYTRLGIQTAAWSGGFWWFGCYGDPSTLLKADASFRMAGRYAFACSLGIAGLPDGRFLVARGSCAQNTGCVGRIVPAVADAKSGLRIVSSD